MSHAPSTVPAVPATPTGLLLTGGGARAAYQVGVLEIIARLRQQAGVHGPGLPFPILSGTSAGAINAAALACGADHFEGAVHRLARLWRHLHADMVYQADSLSMLRSGARWVTLLSLGWALARWHTLRPRSLLDNSPLAALLDSELLPLHRLPELIAQGHLQALAITASSYSSGQHVSFVQAHERLPTWSRSQRRAVAGPITPAHLLASSALPFIFPAMDLPLDGHTEYFGDGSMRQTAPLAPAIHLGAERLLVIGAGRAHEPTDVAPPRSQGYPTLAQIAGHALSGIFLDTLPLDVERAQRINQTLSLIPQADRALSHLRPVELLVITPSQRLDSIAARHVAQLPQPVRTLLAALGVRTDIQDIRGGALASYLLFEPSYTGELMALGRQDAWARRAEICRFFGWSCPADASAQAVPAEPPLATLP